MVTIENMNQLITNLVKRLPEVEVFPSRVVLFGSYAKGKPHAYSDIDIAIWAKGFEGSKAKDYPKIGPIMKYFSGVQIYPIAENETVDDNPFIEEIEKYGIDYTRVIEKD